MKKFVIFALITALAAGAVFAQAADGISFNAWGRAAFSPLVVVGQEQAFGENVDKVTVKATSPTWELWDSDDDPDTPDIWAVKPGKPASVVDAPGSRAYSGAGITWGGNTVRTGFNLIGNAEFVGFHIQLNEDGVTGGDFAYIWAKPFSSDILKLSVGKFDDDTLRGKVDTDSGFEDFVSPKPMNNDAIFSRFRANHSDGGLFPESLAPNGYMLSSEPMDGLFIGLLVNGALWDWGGPTSGTLAQDAFRFMQLGFGYKIPEIGHLRAQWIGGWFGSYDPVQVGKDVGKGLYAVEPSTANVGRIEVAFALEAIDNLTVDLGVKFYLDLENSDTKQKDSNGIDINVGAKFRADAFAITGQLGFFNLGSYSRPKDSKATNSFGSADPVKGEYSPGFAINLIPTYDLDAATIGASIGLAMASGPGKDFDGKNPEADDKWSAVQFGIGGFVQKGLGSGNIRAGLAYKAAPSVTAGKNAFSLGEAKSGACGSGVFSIPIILEYAFF